MAQVNDDTSVSYNGGFRSGNLGAVMNFDFLFANVGAFYYVCEGHSGFGMRGVVFVIPAPSPTASPTPAASAPGEIVAVLASPNPNPTSFLLKLSGSSPRLKVLIFSAGMTKLAELSGPGPLSAGWVSLDAGSLQLGNGTYYFRAYSGQDLKPASLAPGKFSVLK